MSFFSTKKNVSAPVIEAPASSASTSSRTGLASTGLPFFTRSFDSTINSNNQVPEEFTHSNSELTPDSQLAEVQSFPSQYQTENYDIPTNFSSDTRQMYEANSIAQTHITPAQSTSNNLRRSFASGESDSMRIRKPFQAFQFEKQQKQPFTFSLARKSNLAQIQSSAGYSHGRSDENRSVHAPEDVVGDNTDKDMAVQANLEVNPSGDFRNHSADDIAPSVHDEYTSSLSASISQKDRKTVRGSNVDHSALEKERFLEHLSSGFDF